MCCSGLIAEKKTTCYLRQQAEDVPSVTRIIWDCLSKQDQAQIPSMSGSGGSELRGDGDFFFSVRLSI